MMVLQFWREVPLAAGLVYALVPRRTIVEGTDALVEVFDYLLKMVQENGLSYELREVTETLIGSSDGPLH